MGRVALLRSRRLKKLDEVGAEATLALLSEEGGAIADDIATSLRELRRAGIEIFVVAGLARGVVPSVGRGDLFLLTDHLNLTGANPLVGPNDEAIGPRFPDMTGAYDARLREVAKEAAVRLGIPVKEGVLAGLSVKAFAELDDERCEKIRWAGADLVSAGIVPEVIVARHMGVRVLGLVQAGADENSATRLAPLIGEIVREL